MPTKPKWIDAESKRIKREAWVVDKDHRTKRWRDKTAEPPLPPKKPE